MSPYATNIQQGCDKTLSIPLTVYTLKSIFISNIDVPAVVSAHAREKPCRTSPRKTFLKAKNMKPRSPQWEVQLTDEFAAEFQEFSISVQNETFAMIRLLQQFGPQLGRSRVDTLKGSKHANMKELRFDADGVSGDWLSLSILPGVPSYLWERTNLVGARKDFTVS